MNLLQRHFDHALDIPDGIKNLRDLILKLALQGKLVSQDPKDQPVSELLKEIDGKKKELITEGKIKKQEPLSPIKPEEIPYPLPTDWEWVRLGSIGETQTGTTPPKKNPDYEGNYIPFIGPGDIAYYQINYKNNGLSKEGLEQSRLIKRNSIMMVCIGGSIGKAAINEMDVACNQQINTLTPYIMESIRMIFYSMISQYFQKLLIENAGGSSTPIINNQKWMSIPIPLPPLAEQKRIVAKIDELMSLCDKLEKERDERNSKRIKVHTSAVNKLLTAKGEPAFRSSWSFIAKNFNELYSVPENVEELKKAILQLAMMGKLVPQNPKDAPASELLKEIEAEKKKLIAEGKIKKQEPLPPIKPEEMPYELPKGWEWTRLGNIYDFEYGDNLPVDKRSNTGEFPVYGSNGIVGSHNIALVKSKCIVIGRKGSAGALNLSLVEGCWVTDVAYYCIPPKQLDIFFSFMLFQSVGLSDLGKGIKPGINRNEAYMLRIPIPPLAEQKRIVEIIDDLMNLCDTLEKQLSESTNKQSAIFNAIVGRM